MAKLHAPSCDYSRIWRVEKASYTVYPNDETDGKILKQYDFVDHKLLWSGQITQDEAKQLAPLLKVGKRITPNSI